MMSNRIQEGILKECNISVSSGFAVFEKGLSPEALVGKADQRLYEDKARNKMDRAAAEKTG